MSLLIAESEVTSYSRNQNPQLLDFGNWQSRLDIKRRQLASLVNVKREISPSSTASGTITIRMRMSHCKTHCAPEIWTRYWPLLQLSAHSQRRETGHARRSKRRDFGRRDGPRKVSGYSFCDSRIPCSCRKVCFATRIFRLAPQKNPLASDTNPGSFNT